MSSKANKTENYKPKHIRWARINIRKIILLTKLDGRGHRREIEGGGLSSFIISPSKKLIVNV